MVGFQNDKIMGHSCGVRLNYLIKHFFRCQIMLLLLFSIGSVSQAADLDCQSPTGQVARAMFTTQIQDREPTDKVLVLEDKYKKVYFFSDLRNFEGQDVVHRWEHDGHVVAEKVFSVKGPRWRAYSSQQLGADSLGRWTVVISVKDGCPIKAVMFEYIATKPNGEGSAILDLH